MVAQGSGHVVNITTSLVDHADSKRPSALASLTKGGLAAVTRSLAIEYASRGVRVNAVAPGPIARSGAVGDVDRHDPLPRRDHLRHRRDGARRRWSAARLDRRIAITVVDARGREHATPAPHVDGDARLRGELRSAPPDDVVLERAEALGADQRAVLQRDPAAVREQAREEGAQAVDTPVDVFGAGGLAGVGVGLEGRQDRVDVTGCQRALVLGHDPGARSSGSRWSMGGRCTWWPATGHMLW